MKLLDVYTENGYLIIKTDMGLRQQSLKWRGVDRLQEKARGLKGKEIVTTTSGSWDPAVWFATIDEVCSPATGEAPQSTLQGAPTDTQMRKSDLGAQERQTPKPLDRSGSIPKPAVASLEPLQLRAEQGDAEAQYGLARAFETGDGVVRSLLKAVEWYQRAAGQGHAGARLALGLSSDEAVRAQSAQPHRSFDHVVKIYGPPGTGKTSTLIDKVKEAIADGVRPSEIGFFSYTNKATEEAKSRMVDQFPQFKIDEDFPYFQTIHSLAVQSLRARVLVITDRQAREFDGAVTVDRPLMKEGDESSQVVRVKHPVLDASSTARAMKIPLSRYLSELPESQRWPVNKWLSKPWRDRGMPLDDFDVQKCVAYDARYENYKAALGVIDYTDMLERALEDSAALPSLKLLLIDEAQDLNPLQWDLARILIDRSDHCYVAGDDDQAICEPFGASAKHFVELPAKADNEIVLQDSHRVPPAIHQALAPLVAKLSERFPYRRAKTWNPKANSHHGKVGRFNSISQFLESVIFDRAVPSRKSVLLMFATNATLRHVSERLLTKGVAHHAANKLEGTGEPQIRLLTVWGAKGGEADVAALIVDTDIDCKMLHDDPRLEFVAHTRALEEYYFVDDPSAATGGQQVAQKPARIEVGSASSPYGLSQDSLDRLKQKFGEPVISRSRRTN